MTFVPVTDTILLIWLLLPNNLNGVAVTTVALLACLLYCYLTLLT